MPRAGTTGVAVQTFSALTEQDVVQTGAAGIAAHGI